jgi:hypothetical protein
LTSVKELATQFKIVKDSLNQNHAGAEIVKTLRLLEQLEATATPEEIAEANAEILRRYANGELTP